jgi:hypothetical protein
MSSQMKRKKPHELAKYLKEKLGSKEAAINDCLDRLPYCRYGSEEAYLKSTIEILEK